MAPHFECTLTHLPVTPQVDERLEVRERRDEVGDVVHLRGLERAVAWVPRRARVLVRALAGPEPSELVCGIGEGGEPRPCIPFVPLKNRDGGIEKL